MTKTTLCKTKVGNGIKLCVDGEWFYAPLKELSKFANGTTKAITLRTIDELNFRTGAEVQKEEQATALSSPPKQETIQQLTRKRQEIHEQIINQISQMPEGVEQ